MFENEKIVNIFQMINAKLCHDLSGSIGAIYNGSHLLDDKNSNIQKSALKLTQIESTNLINKINFYRLVYSTHSSSEISVVSITKILKDFFNGHQVKLVLNIEDGIILLEYGIAQVALILAHIIAELIYYNGQINLSITSNGNDIALEGFVDNESKIKNFILHLEEKRNLDVNMNNCMEYYVLYLCDKMQYKCTGSNCEFGVKYVLKK